MTSQRNNLTGWGVEPIVRPFVAGGQTARVEFSVSLQNPFRSDRWSGFYFSAAGLLLLRESFPTYRHGPGLSFGSSAPLQAGSFAVSSWQRPANVTTRKPNGCSRPTGRVVKSVSSQFRSGCELPTTRKAHLWVSGVHASAPMEQTAHWKALVKQGKAFAFTNGTAVKLRSVKAVNKEEYREYLSSVHWANLRESKLAINPRCEQCGDSRRIQVHHLRYRKIYDVLVTDLQTLCNSCHCAAHGIDPSKPDTQPKAKRIKNKKLKKATTHEQRSRAAMSKVRQILNSPPNSTVRTPIPHHQQRKLDKRSAKWVLHVSHLKTVLEKRKKRLKNAKANKQVELALTVQNIEDQIALLERKIARFSTPNRVEIQNTQENAKACIERPASRTREIDKLQRALERRKASYPTVSHSYQPAYAKKIEGLSRHIEALKAKEAEILSKTANGKEVTAQDCFKTREQNVEAFGH